jgi:hypothetical protein
MAATASASKTRADFENAFTLVSRTCVFAARLRMMMTRQLRSLAAAVFFVFGAGRNIHSKI